MTSATAAAPVRLTLLAITLAFVSALLVASRADGAGRSWSAYLAPAAACPGSDDPSAPLDAQQRAVGCLVNWARAQDSRARLAQPPRLRRAASLKAKRVVACGELSHGPCGAAPTESLRATGYRYASFGENLFVGPWGEVSARDVVSAWLQSSPHRANVLRTGFRHVGAAPVHASGLFGGDAVVWVATFASPR